MVLYFTSTAVDPPALIYMGKDKFENEELLKYGLDRDIWFHVDKLSSAHVYLRLPDSIPSWESIPESLLNDCSQLVKANSIEGNKKSNLTVIYTPWANVKKSGDMAVGAVTFFNDRKVKRFHVKDKDNAVVNRLNKTKKEVTVDHEAERQERLRLEGRIKKAKAIEDVSAKKAVTKSLESWITDQKAHFCFSAAEYRKGHNKPSKSVERKKQRQEITPSVRPTLFTDKSLLTSHTDPLMLPQSTPPKPWNKNADAKKSANSPNSTATHRQTQTEKSNTTTAWTATTLSCDLVTAQHSSRQATVESNQQIGKKGILQYNIQKQVNYENRDGKRNSSVTTPVRLFQLASRSGNEIFHLDTTPSAAERCRPLNEQVLSTQLYSEAFFLLGALMSVLWMCGNTPPPAMVARTRLSSSSSPRIASCKCRGVMRFTRKSLDALPASSRTSAVRYSKIAEV